MPAGSPAGRGFRSQLLRSAPSRSRALPAETKEVIIVRDGKAQLRLDRRLALRRGWIAEKELEKELAGLPDVAEKGELVDLPGGPASDDEPAADASPSLH